MAVIGLLDEALQRRVRDACDAISVVELTRDLVGIPSYRFAETEIAEFVGNYLRGFGCEVTMQPVQRQDRRTQQAIGVIRGSGGGASLMLCGHLDANCSRIAVGGYSPDANGWYYYRPDQWTKPPFEGVVENGWIYGIGTVNMKSGVAAMLGAARALKEAGVPLRGDLIIAGVAAETAGGVGISALIDSGLRSTYAIVTECTNLSVVNISVAACRGAVKFAGRTLHHTPYPNPTEAAARFVAAMGPTFQPATSGGWLTFQPDPGLPGYPRAAARAISSHGDFATVAFEVRIVPGMNDDTVRADLERLLSAVRDQCPGVTATIELPPDPYILNRPAAPATPLDSPVVERTASWHEKVTGRRPLVGAGDRLGGAADAANLRMAGVQTIEYGPASPDPWPMVDERCSTEQIVHATKVLALTAAELCA